MGHLFRGTGMVLMMVVVAGHGAGQSTTRASVDSAGMQAHGFLPTISADGRWVAFHALASNLVPGDTNGAWDAFVHDRQSGATTLVSLDSAGVQGNDQSIFASISADGRFVAFLSMATNLAPGDTNDNWDVFVHDRQSGRTTRVSVDSSGAQANGESSRPSISGNGRRITFMSTASNLVPSDTNLAWDVFVHDRLTGETVRASVDSDGAQGNGLSLYPSISADGRRVAFVSYADNLVLGDTNGVSDAFVHDLQTGRTRRVSVDSSGVQANYATSEIGASISADGLRVAFGGGADNLVPSDTNLLADIFVHDLPTGRTLRASVDSSGAEANHSSWAPSLSADGRFVAFRTYASNLVPADANSLADILLHDTLSGSTVRVSVDSSGTEADGDSEGAAISADGRVVAFSSGATNLVANDTNGVNDVFVREEGPSGPLVFCPGDGSAGPCPCGNSGLPGHGCGNSAGTGGAALAASGSSSLSSDTLVLTSSGEVPTAPSAFLQATQSTAPASFGDGLGCTGGFRRRLYVESAVLGMASAPVPGAPSVSERSAALGDPIALGSTRFYQVQYRDGSTSFCPSPAGETWNVTNGLALVWFP